MILFLLFFIFNINSKILINSPKSNNYSFFTGYRLIYKNKYLLDFSMNSIVIANIIDDKKNNEIFNFNLSFGRRLLKKRKIFLSLNINLDLIARIFQGKITYGFLSPFSLRLIHYFYEREYTTRYGDKGVLRVFYSLSFCNTNYFSEKRSLLFFQLGVSFERKQENKNDNIHSFYILSSFEVLSRDSKLKTEKSTYDSKVNSWGDDYFELNKEGEKIPKKRDPINEFSITRKFGNKDISISFDIFDGKMFVRFFDEKEKVFIKNFDEKCKKEFLKDLNFYPTDLNFDSSFESDNPLFKFEYIDEKVRASHVILRSTEESKEKLYLDPELCVIHFYNKTPVFNFCQTKELANNKFLLKHLPKECVIRLVSSQAYQSEVKNSSYEFVDGREKEEYCKVCALYKMREISFGLKYGIYHEGNVHLGLFERDLSLIGKLLDKGIVDNAVSYIIGEKSYYIDDLISELRNNCNLTVFEKYALLNIFNDLKTLYELKRSEFSDDKKFTKEELKNYMPRIIDYFSIFNQSKEEEKLAYDVKLALSDKQGLYNHLDELGLNIKDDELKELAKFRSEIAKLKLSFITYRCYWPKASDATFVDFANEYIFDENFESFYILRPKV